MENPSDKTKVMTIIKHVAVLVAVWTAGVIYGAYVTAGL